MTSSVRAGFATADITPAIGSEVPGNYFKQLSTGIHDPLKVRAAVFEGGDCRVAVVGVDTVSVPASTVVAARERIVERVGIPGDHVMVAASHTHSGGSLRRVPAELEGSPELVRKLALEYSVAGSEVYRGWVAAQVASAVEEAHRRLRPARIAVGRGSERDWIFNRRFRMRGGRVVTHPGKGNPDIVEPWGPVDPEVGVIGAWDESGELLGCVVNFGCHCTTAPGGTSADYVYYLERVVQGTFGAGATVVYTAGAAADVTQIDNRSMRERESGEQASRRLGMRVGAEAVKVLVTAEPVAELPVAARTTSFRQPRRHHSRERMEAARERVAAMPSEAWRDAEWLFAKEALILDDVVRREPEASVEVQAIQIGCGVLVSNPCEYFAECGLDIKRRSAFPYTFVVSLANDCLGYVPPRRAFDAERGGGYETVLTSFSNLAVGAAERIGEVSVELLSGLTPVAEPEPARVAGRQAGMSYGVLGPDPGETGPLPEGPA